MQKSILSYFLLKMKPTKYSQKEYNQKQASSFLKKEGIHLQTAVMVGFTQSGAITVLSACPQCCLFTLVAPDWLCVPGNKNCVHVRQCHMLLSPAACFLKSNRWTSAVGYTRNCLQTLRRLCMQVQPRGIGHLLVIYPRAAGGCSFTSEL